MVRATKSEKSSAPVENVVVESTTKSRVKKEKSQPVVETETPAVPETADASASSSISVKLNEYSGKLQQLTNLLTTLKSDFKTLEKTVTRELKNAQKSSNKRKNRNSGTRQPSGFVKPTRISDELAVFLGKTIGSEMARTEVSKEINAYIRAKSLQDKENGRKIHPDAPLSKLLQIGKGDELTYFNLQRYMKHHFIKQAPSSA